MKNLLYFISILFFFLITNNISAQDINENSWMCSFNFNPSLLLSNNHWSLNHPVYQATSEIQYEEVNGIFKQCKTAHSDIKFKRNITSINNLANSNSLKKEMLRSLFPE